MADAAPRAPLGVAVEQQPAARPGMWRVRAVLAWKILEYAGLAIFVVVVPRLMGPDGFGRFAVLLSLVSLMMMGSELGTQATFARFVPEFVAGEQGSRTRALFTQLFLLRGLAAVILGSAFLAVFPRVLDSTSMRTAAFGAAALFVGALGTTAYQLCYGLNQLGRWLTRDALNRILLVAMLVALGGLQSPERAGLALFVTEFALMLLGLYWVRSYFALDHTAFDSALLREHFAFGFVFFVAYLLTIAVWRGGETAIAVFSGQTAEIAHFSVAANFAMALSSLVGQLAAMLTPSITTFHLAGDSERVDAWLGTSLKYLTIFCVAVLLVVWAVGDVVVRALLGPEYTPVARNLQILGLALVPVAFTRTAMSLAIARREPKRALAISGSGLAAFGVAALLLVPRTDSAGASWAVVIGGAVSAAVAYFQFHLHSILAVARFWRLLGISFVGIGLAAMGIPGVSPAITTMGIFLCYPLLLFAARVVSTAEVWKLIAGPESLLFTRKRNGRPGAGPR